MRVLVVGRGFSGSLVSLLLADKGFDVTSADPNPVIPHCTGIVSRRFVYTLGIDHLILTEPQRLIINIGRKEVLIEAPKKAAVIDRERLDEELREASEAAGAKVIKKRVKEITPEGHALIDSREKYRRIIDAEGAKRSLVKRFFGELETFPGVQIDAYAERDDEEVLIDLNVPGLFGRIVPLGDNKARIGVATRKNHRKYMRRLMKRAGFKEEISRRGGLVVVSGPRGGLHKGKIMLVGDAAGVPKPLTGGGLAFGLHNAIVAARNVEDPKRYEREYMRIMGPEYRTQRILRTAKDLSRLAPPIGFILLHLASKISSRLDMDFRSGIRTYPSEDISRIRSYL